MEGSPSGPGPEKKKPIPKITPDAVKDPKLLSDWMELAITEPNFGFRDSNSTNSDGSPMSPEQRVEATKTQLRLTVPEWIADGMPLGKISDYLNNLASNKFPPKRGR